MATQNNAHRQNNDLIANQNTTDKQDNLVTIKDLHFDYQDRPIFNGVSINIPRGKITAIMGPSGTGKTTLLRLIGAAIKPSSGNIHVNGIDVNKVPRKRLFDIRRNMGLLFQSSALFTNMTVFDNIAFPLREHTNLSEAMIRDVVLLKLQIVGLRGARRLMPSELSGGMARRVALARAIALDPELIMYDEPFTGLDPISMAMIVKLIKDLNAALGMTSIIVSHDVPEVSSIADLSYVLSNGKVIGEGTPDALAHDETPAVKQFIHGLADGVVPFHYPAIDFSKDLLSNVSQD